MTQYVRSPTRDNNLLDVLAYSDDRKFIHDVTVDDAGRVSDHRLVKAMFAVGMKRWTPISYQFRPLNAMNFSEFEHSILSSSLFTAPSDKADTFSDQLCDVVSSTLEKLAPLKTVTRATSGKYINRFLSSEAIEAKQKRRRLERCWKITGADSDRRAYRQQCRSTNRLINESPRQHYAARIADMTAGSKKRWSAVNEMLHKDERTVTSSSKAAKHKCDSISAFFTEKICRMQNTITTRLIGQVTDPFTFDKMHSGPLLDSLSSVTTEEVNKLIGSMSSKSSSMDFMPAGISVEEM